MPGWCKRISALAVVLVFGGALGKAHSTAAANDAGSTAVSATVYEMEAGTLTTAASGFSNIIVIRPPGPGVYELSLEAFSFDPYLIVYRGEDAIAYHIPAAGESLARLSLDLDEDLFSKSGGAIFTIVAASRDPGQGGPVTLQITPEVKLLSPQAAFGERFLASFDEASEGLLSGARAIDNGFDLTYVAPGYTAGTQGAEPPSPVIQSYFYEYAAPIVSAQDDQISQYVYTYDGAVPGGSVDLSGVEDMAMAEPALPVSPTEGPAPMAPPPPAMAPFPIPGASGMSPGLPNSIIALEPASGGVDVAAETAGPAASDSGGRMPASVAVSVEPVPHWREFLLPDFKPWPPPKPTTSVVVSKTLYTPFLDVETANYGDVSRLIEAALSIGGYERFAYFRVPGGFALVTQLEQIQENGEPVKPSSARWNAAIAGPRPFDLATYIHRLFFARVGYYRVLVFTVLGEPITLGGDTLAEDPDWIGEGATGLPRVLKEERFTEDHDVTVLVYEFERHEVEPEPKFREDDDSPLLASDHLKGAKFSSYFNGGAE